MLKSNKIFITKSISSNFKLFCSVNAKETNIGDDEFRPLNLKNVKTNLRIKRKQKPVGALPPRTLEMPVDQDWPSVWPGPKTFHPASVPLPIRQGYNEKGAPLAKYGNAELMKIPNFLHLTPPAIKRHCEAIKKFCTKWPENFETDEQHTSFMPLKIIYSDYLHSSPTIRDPMARIVSIQVKLSSLELDTHARDKCLRLVGDRYNIDTDLITITADRCPTKKQNYDYAIYLLTALYHESWTIEPWEKEKSEEDLEYYDWDSSASKKNLHKLLAMKMNCNESDIDLNKLADVQEYKINLTNLKNHGENDEIYEKYGESTKKLLF